MGKFIRFMACNFSFRTYVFFSSSLCLEYSYSFIKTLNKLIWVIVRKEPTNLWSLLIVQTEHKTSPIKISPKRYDIFKIVYLRTSLRLLNLKKEIKLGKMQALTNHRKNWITWSRLL